MNQDPGYVEAQTAAQEVRELLDQWENFDLDGIEFAELAANKIKKITNFFENGNPPLNKKSEDPKARTLYQDLEEGLDDERLEDLELYDPDKESQGSLFNKKGNG